MPVIAEQSEVTGPSPKTQDGKLTSENGQQSPSRLNNFQKKDKVTQEDTAGVLMTSKHRRQKPPPSPLAVQPTFVCHRRQVRRRGKPPPMPLREEVQRRSSPKVPSKSEKQTTEAPTPFNWNSIFSSCSFVNSLDVVNRIKITRRGNPEPCLLLDSRDPVNYRVSHIRGAVNAISPEDAMRVVKERLSAGSTFQRLIFYGDCLLTRPICNALVFRQSAEQSNQDAEPDQETNLVFPPVNILTDSYRQFARKFPLFISSTDHQE